MFVLSECYKQADDDAEKSNTLYKCRGNDHVRTQVAGCFWLTSHCFKRRTANATYTNTCSNSSCTCAETRKALTYSDFKKNAQQFHNVGFLLWMDINSMMCWIMSGIAEVNRRKQRKYEGLQERHQ
jgi:hypothetical protein